MPPIKYVAILLVGLVIQSVIARPDGKAQEDDSDGGKDDEGPPSDEGSEGADDKHGSSGPSEDGGHPEEGSDSEDGKSGHPDEGPDSDDGKHPGEGPDMVEDGKSGHSEDGSDSEDGKSGHPEEGQDSEDGKIGHPEEGPEGEDGKSGHPEEGPDSGDGKSEHSGPPEEGPNMLTGIPPEPEPQGAFYSPYGYQEIYPGKWDAVEYLTLPDIEDALKIGKISIEGELFALEDILKGLSGELTYHGGNGESPKNPKNPFAEITLKDFTNVLKRLRRLDETFTEIVDLHSNYQLKLDEVNAMSFIEPARFGPLVIGPHPWDDKEGDGPLEGGDGKEGSDQKDNGD